jgi:hypothetical protein
MARIRTIKPEFPHSESMGKVSRDARLCFIMLFTLADDEGRLRGNSRMLASLLFPYDDDAKGKIDKWLDELVSVESIVRYQCEGDSFIEIAKWLSHQKIDKPSKSKLPAPTDDSRILSNVREQSPLDQGEDQGSRIKEKKRAIAPRPDDVSEKVWNDWVYLRKQKNTTVSETAISGARVEAAKIGWNLEQFLVEWCTRGSQGLKADWIKPAEKQTFAQQAADIVRTTVPGQKGPDPALVKIQQDREKAVPMPDHIRNQIRSVMRKV